jgi:hypothetical protein
MKMVGHKTMKILSRYAIVESTALNIGGEKLSEYLAAQAAAKSSPKLAQHQSDESKRGA